MDFYDLLLAKKLSGGGGGGDITVQSLSVTANGTYTAPEGKAYSPVMVSVPVGISVDDIAEGTAPRGDITLSDTVTEIANGAFAKKPISSITALNVTKINDYGLQKCPLLTSVNMPNLNTVGTSVFQEDSLTSVNLPNLKYLGASAFQSCSMLPSISLPECRKFLGSYTFQKCTALQEAYFPKFALDEIIGTQTNQAMDQCPNLSIVDFGHVNSISANCFSGDTALETLILRKSSKVVALLNLNAFNNTPFKNGGTGGTIYIPEALYDHLGDGTGNDYQSATNWSTVYGYGTITWAKIEGSIYE